LQERIPVDKNSNNWISLTQEEKTCVQSEFPTVLESLHNSKYVEPCNNATKQCTKFCENSRLLQKHLKKNTQLKKLLKFMSHPTGFQYSSSPVVPFCYQGSEIESIQSNFLKTYNRSDPNYGYTFCKNTHQRWTDVGLCTTIEYPLVNKEF
jgi:hypothetical protein